jgi:endoglucanase
MRPALAAGVVLLTTSWGGAAAAPPAPAVHLRTSLAGYRPADRKVAVLFSERPQKGWFTVRASSAAKPLLRARVPATGSGAWGRFPHHYALDLTAVREPGSYLVEAGGAAARFTVAPDALRAWPSYLLEYLRQQRCGYNPFLDTVCHPFDGRSAYGPLPAGSYVDARGGWHDAGDQLKYLITSSNATAQLLQAWQTAPGAFDDRVDALGRPGANGDADVLDEARWGLEWMLRLHPAPDQLYHQVADDRDHIGWKLPQADDSDYGWGKRSYRVVYAADGRPQGLGQYQSAATGMANLAGRYAAAMALAHQVWKAHPRHAAFAERCLQAAREVYALGREREGFQQGNSFGAPYRYNEDTWADDLEWGAAELFKATGERHYLDDAVRYARQIGATSMVGRDAGEHYQFYPFFNVGHFALHALVEDTVKQELAGYYRTNLEAAERRAHGNPYGVGVPFLWCSNNLAVALATQALLYERMTGDARFRPLAEAQRDWLLGRNPWGTSMFSLVPEGAESPRDVHLSVTHLSGRGVRGGLVDGPVYARIFESLKGVTLGGPDLFADFQGEAVYHDDLSDYSSNEPTMDGTASAVLLFALLGVD